MKTGLYTTEFWLSVLTLIAATVVLITNDIDAEQWVLVVTGAAGAYSVSRGLAKINPPKD